MNDQNPIRWRDAGSSVPDAMRDVIGSAALDDVGADRLARFVARAQATVAAPASSGGAFASGKVVAGVALVAGGALVAWFLWGQPIEHAQARRSDGAGSSRVAESAPAGRAPASSGHVGASPAGGSTRALVADAVVPAADGLAAAPALPTSPVDAPGLPAAPVAAPLERTRVSSGEDSLAEEVRLLQAAREALGSDAAGALRLAEQHRTRFPRGTLAQEREVIAIDALLRQGRTNEAQGRADRFRQRYPRSSHLDRLSILRDNRP